MSLKKHNVKRIRGKMTGKFTKAKNVSAQEKRTAALAVTRAKRLKVVSTVFI